MAQILLQLPSVLPFTHTLTCGNCRWKYVGRACSHVLLCAPDQIDMTAYIHEHSEVLLYVHMI